jgi:hypothetical protein
MEREGDKAGSFEEEERQLTQAVQTKVDELLGWDGTIGTSQKRNLLNNVAEYYVLGLPSQIGGRETTVPPEKVEPNWPVLAIQREYQPDGETPLSAEITINVRKNAYVFKTFTLRCFAGSQPDFKYSCQPRSVARPADRYILKDFLAILSGDCLYFISKNHPPKGISSDI